MSQSVGKEHLKLHWTMQMLSELFCLFLLQTTQHLWLSISPSENWGQLGIREVTEFAFINPLLN